MLICCSSVGNPYLNPCHHYDNLCRSGECSIQTVAWAVQGPLVVRRADIQAAGLWFFQSGLLNSGKVGLWFFQLGLLSSRRAGLSSQAPHFPGGLLWWPMATHLNPLTLSYFKLSPQWCSRAAAAERSCSFSGTPFTH